MPKRPLIDLANRSEMKNTTQFRAQIEAWTKEPAKLKQMYEEERALANGADSRPEYLLKRLAETKPLTNRREEHLAKALYNFSRENEGIPWDGDVSRRLHLVNYQMPLKAERSDETEGVGKVDLVGVLDGRVALVELKVARYDRVSKTFSAREAPARIVFETLAYCAIVEANFSQIKAECEDASGIACSGQPIIVGLAPPQYWKHYTEHSKSEGWEAQMTALSSVIKSHLGIATHLLSLHGADWFMTAEQRESPPALTNITVSTLLAS